MDSSFSSQNWCTDNCKHRQKDTHTSLELMFSTWQGSSTSPPTSALRRVGWARRRCVSSGPEGSMCVTRCVHKITDSKIVAISSLLAAIQGLISYSVCSWIFRMLLFIISLIINQQFCEEQIKFRRKVFENCKTHEV